MIATAQCPKCIPAPQLSVHYAPGMLVVLKRVPKTYRFPVAEPNGRNRMAPIGYTHNPEVIAGLYLLQGDEQDWCLERSWVKK